MFTFPLTCRKLPLYLSIDNVGLCIFGMYFCLQYPDSFLGRDGQFSGWTEPQPVQGSCLMSLMARIVSSSRMISQVTIIMLWKT